MKLIIHIWTPKQSPIGCRKSLLCVMQRRMLLHAFLVLELEARKVDSEKLDEQKTCKLEN